MTNEEKLTISNYRKNGIGYKRISQLTGISENTIKTFCKRNGLGGSTTDSNCTCLNCGKKLIHTEGRKKKKFCSDKCRTKWWNANLDKVNRKAVYEFVCPTCHKTFTVYGNAKRKYCSHECYIAFRFGGEQHG